MNGTSSGRSTKNAGGFYDDMVEILKNVSLEVRRENWLLSYVDCRTMTEEMRCEKTKGV
jgi:hypothetical protein